MQNICSCTRVLLSRDRKDIQTPATMRTGLEGIMLGERRQSQKFTYMGSLVKILQIVAWGCQGRGVGAHGFWDEESLEVGVRLEVLH